MFDPRKCSQPITFCAFLFVACLLLCGIAGASPSITLSKKSGPPTSQILVSGSGFQPNAGVDIFFDTKDKALVVTNGKGEFHNAGIYAPRSAHPGEDWVTALERNDDKGAQQPFLVQTNWSEFHFDADGTRFNPYENVLNPETVKGLDLKWSYSTNAVVYSSPAIANGVVYIGSDKLYALDARTGAKLWSYDTVYYVQSSPAVANGVVYVGSAGDSFYALNASTGALLWTTVTGTSSSPAVEGGVVYVGCSGDVCALDASTGAQLWYYATGANVISSPTVANGVVYVGSEDSSLYALDARTGTKLWSYQTGSSVLSSPAVANGVVYVSDDYNVYALNASTGVKLWSYAPPNLARSSPAVANGVVYIGEFYGLDVRALDGSTGAELWSFATGGNVQASPAVANGVVYVGSADGNLYALDARTGGRLWSYANGNIVYSSPAVANGVVYVGSYAFGHTNGDRAKRDRTNQGAAPKQPDLKKLRPDFSLKASKVGPNAKI